MLRVNTPDGPLLIDDEPINENTGYYLPIREGIKLLRQYPDNFVYMDNNKNPTVQLVFFRNPNEADKYKKWSDKLGEGPYQVLMMRFCPNAFSQVKDFKAFRKSFTKFLSHTKLTYKEYNGHPIMIFD